MEREARAREFKMDQAKAQSEQELRQLVGKPIPVPGTEATETSHLNGASASKSLSDTHLDTHGHTRVERGAIRDTVGELVELRPTPKCTFAGVVPIDSQRFLASSVRLVECLGCGRTCSLSPKNGVLRFPPHDRRKKEATLTSQLWARIDVDWDVVEGKNT